MRPGLISGCIIALIIMVCAGGPAFAARVAGADENVNTTTAPANTVKKIIKAAPVAPVKQGVPAAEEAIIPAQSKDAVPKDSPEIKTVDPVRPSAEVKTEEVIQPPEEIQDEKLPAHHTKKAQDKRYVTLDFDNVDILKPGEKTKFTLNRFRPWSAKPFASVELFK